MVADPDGAGTAIVWAIAGICFDIQHRTIHLHSVLMNWSNGECSGKPAMDFLSGVALVLVMLLGYSSKSVIAR